MQAPKRCFIYIRETLCDILKASFPTRSGRADLPTGSSLKTRDTSTISRSCGDVGDPSLNFFCRPAKVLPFCPASYTCSVRD